MGGWVGLRASLDSVEKNNLLPVPGIEPQFLSIQRVAHCFTDGTILAHFGARKLQNSCHLLFLNRFQKSKDILS
jgi:hypothetical protein